MKKTEVNNFHKVLAVRGFFLNDKVADKYDNSANFVISFSRFFEIALKTSKKVSFHLEVVVHPVDEKIVHASVLASATNRFDAFETDKK